MQKINLKLDPRKKPPESGGGVSAETSLSAWVWAERIRRAGGRSHRELRFFHDYSRNRIDPYAGHHAVPAVLFCHDFLDALRERGQRRHFAALCRRQGW